MQLRVHRVRALGGPCALHLYAEGEAALDRAAAAGEAELLRIEHKYSRYREDSIVSQINARAGSGESTAVDEETAALLAYAATLHEQSGGRFDITSGILRRAWDFKARRVPAQSEIDALLPLIGWNLVEWRKPDIALTRSGMELDFGGFGKEYAADRVAATLSGMGIRHGLVDLGGDLRVIGPHPDGAPWQIGIQHPRAEGAIAVLSLGTGAIASSGDYERGFERDGVRYGHILNAATGWPAQGLAAVSVLAQQCLIAGSAATCAMLLGAVDGPEWLSALGLPYLCIDAQMKVSGSVDYEKI
jgi:thiamine biosynthesis lipoprotein